MARVDMPRSASDSHRSIEWGDHADTLRDGSLTIGRGPDCDIRLADASVSRVHLRIYVEGDVIVARDLGSRNGTWVNGAVLRGERQLAADDEIQLGAVSCRLRVRPRDALSSDDTARVDLPEPSATGTHPGIGDLAFDHRCPHCQAWLAHDATQCPSCRIPLSAASTRALDGARSPTAQAHAVVAPRKSARSRVDIPARCRRGVQISLVGAITDLSEEGLFFQTDGLLEAGVSCTVQPDEDPHIELRGRVRHVIHRGPGGQRGLGIELFPADERTRRWIDQACAELSSFDA